MLSISDYNQLKLLYENYIKFSILIKQLAADDDWESIENTINDKNAYLRKIIFFEKSRIDDIKENDELLKLRNQIIEMEKENIVFINQLKDDLTKEIGSVKQTKKIYNAYIPLGQDSISTFEVADID